MIPTTPPTHSLVSIRPSRRECGELTVSLHRSLRRPETMHLKSRSARASSTMVRTERHKKVMPTNTSHFPHTVTSTAGNRSITRTTIEPPFLIHGLGLDPSLFEPPIHRLPPELLGYIFSFDDLTSSAFPTPFAWTVAHVSGLWRQVAFGMPRLWSTFVLDLSSLRMTTRRLEDQLEFLDTCLALSKTAPLNFVVSVRSQKTNICNAVFSRLCRHTHRWRRAFFVMSTDVFTPWKHLIHDNTPILENLGVGCFDGDTGSIDIHDIFANSGVSKLALTFYQNESNTIGFNVPWLQITSLKLIACAFNILPLILNQLPNLKELELAGDLPRSGAVYFGQPIQLPNLSTLRVSGYLHHIRILLPILNAPALVNLSMTLYRASFVSRAASVCDARVVNEFVSLARRLRRPVVKYIDQDDVDTMWDHVIRYIH